MNEEKGTLETWKWSRHQHLWQWHGFACDYSSNGNKMVEFYGYTCGNIQEHTEQKYWTIYGCFELIEDKKAREQVLKLNCHMKNTVFGAKFEWIIQKSVSRWKS